VLARAFSSLLIALAVSACSSEHGAKTEPPRAEAVLDRPSPIAQPADPSLDPPLGLPGTMVRLLELPAPGPYHLAVLPDGCLAASRSDRTLVIDESGRLLRELPFGGLLASDLDGNLYVAGEFSDSIELFGVRYDSAGGLDAFVAKLDANGDPAWVRQLGGPEQQRPRALAIHGRDLVVMGSGIGTLELDRAGNTVWSTALAGTDLAIEPDGNLFLAGGFVDELQIGADTHYADQPSIFIAKLDAVGKPVWSRALQGTSVAHIDRLDTDPDGNLALVGSFRGKLSLGGAALVHESPSGQPYTAGFFAKYDRDGNHLYSARSELANHFELVGDASGNFALTGNVSDEQTSLELRVIGPDGRELWRKSGPAEIELGTGYGFDLALERDRLHWSVDAYSASHGGAVLVPQVASFVH
jgi:hypothetical protein